MSPPVLWLCDACDAHSGKPQPPSSPTNRIITPSDPNRPGLYYHYANPPTPLSPTIPAFALSFLSETPPSVDSASVIGWLPAASSESEQTENGATLADFKQNSKFIEFLHESIKSGLKEGVDDVWKDSAMALGDGWMHIHDQRNPPDQSRIGDPDDIIASVLVKGSQIQPDMYEPMPSYRVCTADGVLQLTPGLAAHLRRELLRAVQTA
ncbi:unnamed protein product [Cyclocybe aegerita]|uniref:Uncharacterized protein n=1 Tax=Cyclocybe aegerita TaxID=1973307 RepID=A0A8S0XFM3_CYCAE|nr:unnamed protein product [Cyclocybe aegerita]